MRISLYTDYLVRVMIQAALRDPGLATVDEVAETYAISRHHLVKIVHHLGREGFLSTRRGVGGGFRLACVPEQIRLGDLIRLGEGKEAIVHCKDRRDEVCRLFPACRLKDVLSEAEQAFFAVLDRYTLHDLLHQPKKLHRLLNLQPH